MRSHTTTILCLVSGIAAICLDRWAFNHDGEMFALGIVMLVIALFSLPSLEGEEKTQRSTSKPID